MVTRTLEYDANDPRWGDTSISVSGASGDVLQIPGDHSALTVDFGVVATACTVSVAARLGSTFVTISEDADGNTYPRASFSGAVQRSFRVAPGSAIRISGTGVTYSAVSYRDKVVRSLSDVPGLRSELDVMRPFKPDVAGWPYLSTGSVETSQMTDAEIVAYIEGYADAGVNSIGIFIHVEPRPADYTTYVIAETLPKLLLAADTALSLGMSITCLKFHQKYAIDNYATIDRASWAAQHRAAMVEVFDAFAGYDIPYCCTINEAYAVWEDSASNAYALDFIALAKSRGYLVGMSGGCIDFPARMPTALVDAMDVFMFNEYPRITNIEASADWDDGIEGWRNASLMSYLPYYRQLYPTKPIIISETGCQANWQALASPWTYTWATQDFWDYSGKPAAIFLQGMFEALKESEVAAVWLLYDIDYTETRKVIRRYVRGG